MECQRGSICTESTHEVKTMQKAQEWYQDVKESDLPITVYSSASSNGRLYARIYGVKGNLIHVRG